MRYIAIRRLPKHPGLVRTIQFLLALLGGFAMFHMGSYDLRVQDRLIHLMEYLHFASGAEVPEHAHQALVENLNGDAIIKHIKTWQPRRL